MAARGLAREPYKSYHCACFLEATRLDVVQRHNSGEQHAHGPTSGLRLETYDVGMTGTLALSMEKRQTSEFSSICKQGSSENGTVFYETFAGRALDRGQHGR